MISLTTRLGLPHRKEHKFLAEQVQLLEGLQEAYSRMQSDYGTAEEKLRQQRLEIGVAATRGAFSWLIAVDIVAGSTSSLPLMTIFDEQCLFTRLYFWLNFQDLHSRLAQGSYIGIVAASRPLKHRQARNNGWYIIWATFANSKTPAQKAHFCILNIFDAFRLALP